MNINPKTKNLNINKFIKPQYFYFQINNELYIQLLKIHKSKMEYRHPLYLPK